MHTNPRHINGFSLIELSIVLVIIGLLIGGILAGQSLIRASELRSITTDYSRYKTAIGAFQDKYFALPGDMANATAFWTMGTCPGKGDDTPAPVQNTCNGNGNGMIDAQAVTSNEVFRFWQHLALAGLIESSYTGVAATTAGGYQGNYRSFTTPNIPASKLANAGWNFLYVPNDGYNAINGSVGVSDTIYFDGNYGNIFNFGGISANQLTTTPQLRPEEAWNIDTKLDDGKPALGIVRTREDKSLAISNTAGCTNPVGSTTASMAAADYTFANTGLNCHLLINSGY